MHSYFCRDERDKALRFARELELWAAIIRDEHNPARRRLDWGEVPPPPKPRYRPQVDRDGRM